VMSGGDGNDSLVAGAATGGADTMFGGAGNDLFAFATANIVAFSAAPSTAHVISDFSRGSDKIDLLFMTGTPAVTSGTTFGTTNSIVYETGILHIHGGANLYLTINITGVSVVDVNDFEFL